MGARKALVRQDHPSLRRILKERFERTEDQADLITQGRVHASSIGDLCPREEVIAARMKVPRLKEKSFDLELTFALGSGMHWATQNRLSTDLSPHVLGSWKCLQCGKLTGSLEDRVPLPKECSCGYAWSEDVRHGEPGFQYVECRVENKDYRVSGYLDGLLRFPDADGDGVLEVKSAGQKAFAEIADVPAMGHVIQLQTYLWLTDLRWGILLYWAKAQFRSPWVEHYIERDEDTIDKIKETLRGIWDGIDTGKYPDRICRSQDCKRAEGCSLVSLCFEGVLE